MAIWITGDTHIPRNINKVGQNNWLEGNTLTKKDYLIVLGDFGLLWKPDTSELETYWTTWLDNRKWTTLFIDGNHENHDRLNKLDKVDMFDGTVGKVSDNIFHLKRGEVYTIDGKKFFCMGGALSIDKYHRTEGYDWWREEQPSHLEQDQGISNLEKHNNKVDYILTHTAPYNLLPYIIPEVEDISGLNFGVPYEGHRFFDNTCKYLQHICDTVEYKMGYCGHWHIDMELEKYTILYHDIRKIF